MAIADTIQSMYDNVGDVYDTITNVDLPTNKNIQNIPSTMRSSYLEIMNNGIDTIWNNWEKVTGEGETLTLNGTEEAPMKINLKGNTSQESTTGKNKLDLTGITTRTISAGITITPNFNGDLLQNIKISGTPTTTAWQTLKRITLPAGSYIMTGINISQTTKTGLRIGVYIDSARQYFINANSTSYSFTLEEETSMDFVVWVQNVNFYPTGDIYVTPMIRLSSVSDDTYEPYTNGASPNPDYPQDIHVVSGDNSINVCGKNLWGEEEHGGIDENTGVDFYNATRWRTVGFISAQPNTSYTISSNASSNIWYIFYYYDKNKNFISSKPLLGTTSVNWETPSNCEYMRCVIADTASITTTQRQLELGSTATTYEEFKGASYPISLGVENLFDYTKINDVANGTNNNGVITQTGGNCIVYFQNGVINIKSGEKLYLSCDIKLNSSSTGAFNNLNDGVNATTTKISNPTLSTTYQRYITSIDYTSDSTVNRMLIQLNLSGTAEIKNIQISKINSYNYYAYGTTPIELCKIGDYQDYIYKDNGSWYLHKEIGKYVFNSTSVTSISTYWLQSKGVYGASIPKSTLGLPNNSLDVPSLCTSAHHENRNWIVNNNDYNFTVNDGLLFFFNDSWDTKEKANTALNGAILYYVLPTSTNTEITDTTLLSQLEALNGARSYTTQTNINQVNNDKPFILDVTALKQLTQ